LVLSRAGDGQLRLAQQRLGDGDLALVALRVDDPHARRGDGDVVDVRATAGNAAVVQDDDTVVEVLGEQLRNVFLAAGARGPDLLVRRVVAERQHQTTEAWVLFAHALLAVHAPPLVLATRARAGDAEVQLGRRVG
jgi:hypothetical protein